MASSNRPVSSGLNRRILRETTRKNRNPDPSLEVTTLQDELDITNVEWQQAYNDLQETLKILNDAFLREINFIITMLMREMIDKIDHKVGPYRKSYMKNSNEQQKSKKQKLN